MPQYIWDWVCLSQLEDGRYSFPEGTVVHHNSFVGWKPAESEGRDVNPS